MSVEGWLPSQTQAARADLTARSTIQLPGLAEDVPAELRPLRGGRCDHLADHGPFVPWLADATGTVVDVGARGVAKLGLAPDAAFGSGWAAVVHADDRGRIAAAWASSMATLTCLDIEVRLPQADESCRWFRLRATPRCGRDGHVLAWLGTAEDCDDRYRALDALRQSEERYRLAMRATSHVVWDCDLASGTIVWNVALEARFGYLPGSFDNSARWWRQHLHPDDRERVVASLRRAIDGGSEERWSEHYRFRRADGSYADIQDAGYLVRQDDGPPTRMVGAMIDCTERQQVVSALRASEERYRYTIELSAQIPWTATADGSLCEVGERWCDVTGVSIADSLGTRSIQAFHPDDLPAIKDAWRRCFATGEPHDHEFRLRMRDGSYRWHRSRAAALRGPTGEILRWYGTTEDVHERRSAENETRWQLSHDMLTGIGNRRALREGLSQGLQESARTGRALAVLVLDVDRFKLVNDSFGHAGGDELLKWCGDRLKRLGETLVAARLGGDEFAVVLTGDSQAEVERRAEHVAGLLRGSIQYAGAKIECSVSAGLAVSIGGADSQDDLLKNADVALYDAKASGRDCLRVFRSEMRAELQRTSSMLCLAREAIQNAAIRPYYQPKVKLASGRVVGFEALLRWIDPIHGVQLPGLIAAAFDDRELSSAISACMLGQIVADVRCWLGMGVEFGRIAVNASGADLRDPRYAEWFLGRLGELPTSRFELEVTESVFLGRGTDCVEKNIRDLSSAGISVALDDFGTGYASLSHLQHFPVDVIKIDRSFVAPLRGDCAEAPITNAVIGLAKSFRMVSVAEGIETADQAVLLRRAGCDVGQGFLFGDAQPASHVPALAASRFRFHLSSEAPTAC